MLRTNGGSRGRLSILIRPGQAVGSRAQYGGQQQDRTEHGDLVSFAHERSPVLIDRYDQAPPSFRRRNKHVKTGTSLARRRDCAAREHVHLTDPGPIAPPIRLPASPRSFTRKRRFPSRQSAGPASLSPTPDFCGNHQDENPSAQRDRDSFPGCGMNLQRRAISDDWIDPEMERRSAPQIHASGESKRRRHQVVEFSLWNDG